LVAHVVEDFAAALEFLDADAHAIVRRKENATKDALLGFDGMGREAIDDGGHGQGRAFFAAAALTLARRGAGAGKLCVSGIDHNRISGQI
jgi:hypothetical protein